MNSYKEVLNPPLSWMSFIFFMYFSIAVAIWGAFDIEQAAITMALLIATMPYLWFKLRMIITINLLDNELHVDRAHIELRYLSDPIALSAEKYRALRTVNLDARSFHATRPWLKTGVQVFLNDERDQTTYWLIGSQKCEALVAELIKRSRDKQR